MIAESTCGTGYQPVRSYTWGLDLAGLNGSVNSLQAAGGIGGLLAAYQAALDRPGTSNDVAAGDYGFTYDGNGNIVQVVNVSDYGYGNFHWQAVRTMAVYEYDAYGNVIGPDTSGDGQFNELDDVGPYAAENPMRFSTKYFDRETGLGNWGYRYYSPALGRWVSRDPIGELGGVHLYAYVRNRPSNEWDGDGRFPSCAVQHCDGVCDNAVGGQRRYTPEWNTCHSDCMEQYVDAPAWPFCDWEPPMGPNLGIDLCTRCAARVGALTKLDTAGTGAQDGRNGNAMRHCLAACRTAEECGDACAFSFWMGREHGMNRWSQVDIWNNFMGLGCAGSEGGCEGCCERLLKLGRLMCLDAGTRCKVVPCKPEHCN